MFGQNFIHTFSHPILLDLKCLYSKLQITFFNGHFALNFWWKILWNNIWFGLLRFCFNWCWCKWQSLFISPIRSTVQELKKLLVCLFLHIWCTCWSRKSSCWWLWASIWIWKWGICMTLHMFKLLNTVYCMLLGAINIFTVISIRMGTKNSDHKTDNFSHFTLSLIQSFLWGLIW